MSKYFIAFFAGIIALFSFQPFGYLLCLFISFAIFFYYLNHNYINMSKIAFYYGWCYGFGYFLGGIHWIACALHVDLQSYWWLIPLTLIFIPGILAINFAMIGLLYYKITYNYKMPQISKLLLFICLWSLFEWFKSYCFPQFPWLNIVESLFNSLIFLQPVALFGSHGFGLIVLLLFSLLYILLIPPYKMTFYKISIVTIFCIIAGFLTDYGNKRLTDAQDTVYEKFNLLIVQPDINQIDKLDFKKSAKNLQTLIKITDQALKKQSRNIPHLVIFPEASIPIFTPENEKNLIKYIAKIIGNHDFLIFGNTRYHQNKLYNSMYTINNKGKVLNRYDKINLVPFGEYLPFNDLLPNFITQNNEFYYNYTPGKIYQSVKLNGIPPFAPMICFEVAFAIDLDNTPQKPSWIINISNDGWFLHSSAIYQHLNIARLRAIENGIPVIRCVYKGISAVINAYGKIEKIIPFEQQKVLQCSLPKPLEQKTIYKKYKNKIYIFILGLFLISILIINYFFTKTRKYKLVANKLTTNKLK